MKQELKEAVKLIKNASYGVVFTGAGVSVESGIAPFTGQGGLWNQYDPKYIEIHFFQTNPTESWREMKKIFFTDMHDAFPNKAHEVIARLEEKGFVKGVITQNIDGLHQRAGSKNVQEFHGTIHTLSCVNCARKYKLAEVNLEAEPPVCCCGGVVKPDFVFYGEGIPPLAYEKSLEMAQNADVMIIVGTAGQVMPACSLPLVSKQFGAKIIEVNPLPSAFTGSVTDLYFPQKAGDFFAQLEQAMKW